RDGEAALGVAEILEGGLEMGGHGVMDGCGNSLLAERRGDAVAIVHFNGVLGVNAAVFRSDKRGLDEAAQMLVVASGNMGAKEQFPLENLKLGQQDSGLDSVEASVEAEADVAVAGGLAVVANFEHGGGECVVVRETGPAVAVSAQRLGGEKAGAADGSEVAGVAALVGCSEALRGIFDNGQSAGGDLNRVDVGALAIERNGENGAGARGDGGGHAG